MRKLSFAVLLLAIALAACGGSDKKTGATGTTSPTPTESTTVAAGSGSASGYCGLAKVYQSQGDEISNAFKDIDFSNPEKAKQQLADAYRALTPKFKKSFAEALAVAPAEIRDDIKILGEGFVQFLDAMEKAGYDFTKLGSNGSFAGAFSDPKFQAAAQRVGKYGADKCGIPFTPVPAAS